jgi:hypothetical protein
MKIKRVVGRKVVVQDIPVPQMSQPIPDGYAQIPGKVDVFTNGHEMIVTGEPFTADHNCDEMGCSSIGPHVVFRQRCSFHATGCEYCGAQYWFKPPATEGIEYICPVCQEEVKPWK